MYCLYGLLLRVLICFIFCENLKRAQHLFSKQHFLHYNVTLLLNCICSGTKVKTLNCVQCQVYTVQDVQHIQFVHYYCTCYVLYSIFSRAFIKAHGHGGVESMYFFH